MAEPSRRVRSIAVKTQRHTPAQNFAPSAQARRTRQATNGHIDLHNDEHNERLIDTK